MKTLYTDKGAVSVDCIPDTCPACHFSIAPEELNGYMVKAYESELKVSMVFKCTKSDCQEVFISKYTIDDSRQKSLIFILTESFPSKPKKIDQSKEVQEISPAFCEIYNQAYKSEVLGLEQISGVGYRKALEFLIKDYCISKLPSEKENISKTQLARVIENYIESQKIKDCSKRATWLGNDETHYIRKWTDKDIHDLKVLIKLVCHWISQEVLTDRYLKEMQ